MPLSGLTSGQDVTLTINDVDGPLVFTKLKNFTSRPNMRAEQRIQINGEIDNPVFFEGWTGSFEFDRASKTLDEFIATLETRYYQGGDQLPITITQTITEADGSLSQWQYTNVAITLESAGQFSGTAIVTQTLNFVASRKLNMSQVGV